MSDENVKNQVFSNSELVPNEIDEVLDKVPEEQRSLIREQLSIFMSQQEPESAISRKMTPEHISTYIKDSGEDMRLRHGGKKQTRRCIFIIAVLTIILLGFIVYNFTDKPDVIEKIFFAVGGLIAGLIGGFGIGKSRADE